MARWLSAVFLAFFVLTVPVFAVEPDVSCIGESVGGYMQTVLSDPRVDGLGNVRFLSPAFNLTSPYTEEMITRTKEAAGGAWSKLDGIAGNAYNTSYGSISDFVAAARALGGGKPIMLTEIGWYPPGGKSTAELERLRDSIRGLESDDGVLGALLFNAFGSNADSSFAGNVMSDAEVDLVCGGSCGKVGVNSARYYSSPDSFYQRAGSHGMALTLEIANNDVGSVLPGVTAAHAVGAAPVIRLGVGASSGGFDDPAALADFLVDLNGRVGGVVYVIVGPNEPETESWAAPGCEYGDVIGGGGGRDDLPTDANGRRLVTFSGEVFSSRVVTISNIAGEPETAARPVWGASVCTYEGDKPTGSKKGRIPFPVDCGVTDQDGHFSVRAVYSEDTRFQGSNFMAICAGKREGTDDCWLRELYILDTSDHYRNFSFMVDSSPFIPEDIRINSVSEMPEELDYMNRDNFLSCESDTLKAGAFLEEDNSLNYTSRLSNPGGSVEPILRLGKKVDYYKGTRYSAAATPGESFPASSELSNQSLEGRLDAIKSVDLRAVAGLIQSVVGTYFDEVETPKEGEDPQPLPECSRIKECNFTLSTGSGGCNSQKSGGPGLHLASPIYIRAMYNLALPMKDVIPVCTLGGETMYLKDIMPPWEIGTNFPYPLNWEYFPYQKLLGFDPQAIVKEREFVESRNDSYGNDITLNAGCRFERFPNDADFARNRGKRQKEAWAACNNSVLPAGTAGELSTVTLNYLTTDKIVNYSGTPQLGGPPTAALHTPSLPFGSGNPDLRFEKGGFYRIGLQERLCNCSATMDGFCGDPINEQTFLDNAADVNNPFSSGYDYVTSKSVASDKEENATGESGARGKGEVFFKDPVRTNIFLGFINGLKSFWDANFTNWDETWSQCVEEERVASCDPASDSSCRVVTRTVTTGRGGVAQQNSYYTKSKTSPYKCKGDIRYLMNAAVDVQKTFNAEPGDSVLELYEPFSDPKIVSKRRNIGTIDMIDVAASNLEEENDGYGALFGNGSGTGAGLYSVEYVKRGVSDPNLSRSYSNP